ncbi:hypothetical protein CVT25_003410 [Psilocybe cyanescens]|uniref:BTB domain-containing protein n=1 Tax=Psilocybe cyanescens TaxID=93625 RepID=A0A409WLY2_PSICY|nr:hypothetical protein CVT25_003410 [Psilocybe cyanescens]
MSSTDSYYSSLEFSSDSFSDISRSVLAHSAPGSDDADFLANAFDQLETGSPSAGFQFNPVDDLWFHNIENVVLQAEDHFFRVPPTLFFAKSSVFSDIYHKRDVSSTSFFTYAYHGNDPKIIEQLGAPGCTIIKMLGVTAVEAATFLSALIDPEYFEGPPARETLEFILAIFKLASKYEVRFLRRRALAHLERVYPCSDIDDWDRREDFSTFSIERQEFHCHPVSSTLTGTLNIIELCTAYNVPWILPTAFYECCLYDMKTLLAHPKWKDCPGSLPNDIKTRIICGYLAHKEESSRVLAFLHTDLPHCENEQVCSNIRRVELRKLCTVREQPREMQDFLGKVWDMSDWDEFVSQGMCNSCLSCCKALHRAFRQVSWDNLPAMYGLPNWDKLRAQRQAL